MKILQTKAIAMFLIISTLSLSSCISTPTTDTTVSDNTITDTTVPDSTVSDTPISEDPIYDYYSKKYGISIEETIHRFKLQESAGELQAILTEKESATFGGLWIEHAPQFRIIVLFTHDVDTTIKPYIVSELEGYVETRQCAVSLIDLQKAQIEALAQIRNTKIGVDSSINVYQNCVEIRVAKKDWDTLNELLQNGVIKLPSHVVLIQVDNLATPAGSAN